MIRSFKFSIYTIAISDTTLLSANTIDIYINIC